MSVDTSLPQGAGVLGEKKKKKRPPRRRPVDPAMILEVKRLSGLGLTREQIHNYYGMREDAWARRVKEYPELEMAMHQGKAEAIGKVTDKLWAKIEQGNMSAITFYLKTQAHWRERDYNVGYGDGSGGDRKFPPVVLTVHDPVEASKIYQQIMRGS